MKLTGKCKEEFLEWHKQNYSYLHQSSYNSQDDFNKYLKCNEILINALIIEFFDSVEIRITVMACNDKTFDSELRTTKVNFMTAQFMDTRTEATNAAIEKANGLYNLEK